MRFFDNHNKQVAGLHDKMQKSAADDDDDHNDHDDHDDAKEANATKRQKELNDRRVSWWERPVESWTEDERLLACGAAVVSRLRAAVRSELQYSCTAGERTSGRYRNTNILVVVVAVVVVVFD